MKTLILTITLLFGLQNCLLGQSALIPKAGSSFSDLELQLELLPQLTIQKVKDSLLVYGNEYIKARYNFENGKIQYGNIEHSFDSREHSQSEVSSYLFKLREIGATVIPLYNDDKTSLYSIYLDDMKFDLLYRDLGRKNHSVTLKMKALYEHDTDQELLNLNAHVN